MSIADRIRAKAHAAIDKLPGKAGELARKANEALGRPLADKAELADRQAFATRTPNVTANVKATRQQEGKEPAPVIVYHMDKTRRDATRLTEILDAEDRKSVV